MTTKYLERLKSVIIELYLPSIVLLGILAAFYFALGFALKTQTPVRIVEIDMEPWWTTSMYPALFAGDVVFVEGISPSDLQVGDVILFTRPYSDKVIIHRIIEIFGTGDSRSFRTKGDHNPVADGYVVKRSDLVGRWTGVKVQFVGLPVLLAQTDGGRLIVISLLVVITLYSLLVEEESPKEVKEDPPPGQQELQLV